MSHQFTFTTAVFAPEGEPANPINPIGGEALLRWVIAGLDRSRYVISEPDAEDWGWYSSVVDGPRTYLLGASGEWPDDGGATEWTIQLELQRSLRDRLTGVKALDRADALSAAIESRVRQHAAFADITVSR